MRHKTFDQIEVKAAGDSGEFTALASVYGNVDLVGDRILPGAFDKTLAEWRDSGDPVPIILSHQWDDPMAYIGKAMPQDIESTADGLVVKGTIDTKGNPIAKQTYSLMKEGLIKGWSFGYTVPDGGEEFKDGVNNVSEVSLIENGPTLKGANPQAQLQAIKSVVEAEGKSLELLTPAELLAVETLRKNGSIVTSDSTWGQGERQTLTQPPIEGDDDSQSGDDEVKSDPTPSDPLLEELALVRLSLGRVRR